MSPDFLWTPNNLRSGEKSEFKVAAHFSKVAFPLAHRWKTKLGEIDLLFYLPRYQALKLIEVKSAPHSGFEMVRLGTAQKRRLLAMQRVFENFSSGGCELVLVQVQDDQILELPVTCT